MKKRLIAALFVVLFNAIPGLLQAKVYDMMFWYPGEEGSTAEAAPVLSSFFDYINKKTGTTFGGKYFNTVPAGLKYIKSKKPAFAIVSWIALNENKSSLPAYGVMADTMPLPYGKVLDQFAVVGRKLPSGGKWDPSSASLIYTSIPMSAAFLKANLIPGAAQGVSINTTSTLLMTLKKIASGEITNAVALLTPTEKFTLDHLKSAWTGGLQELYKCRPIPTAKLIYFGNTPPVTGELMKALREMSKDKEGKEILEALRLKGFQSRI